MDENIIRWERLIKVLDATYRELQALRFQEKDGERMLTIFTLEQRARELKEGVLSLLERANDL